MIRAREEEGVVDAGWVSCGREEREVLVLLLAFVVRLVHVHVRLVTGVVL